MRALLVAGALALLAGCAEPPSTIEAVQAAGELRIATVNSGGTYFEGPDGYLGFDHDLAGEFATWLGVEPRYVVAHGHHELPGLLERGHAHLAAALLPIHARFGRRLLFGPSYATLQHVVIYRNGRPAPEDVEALRDVTGVAPAGRGAEAVLHRNLPREEGYRWSIRPDLSIEELLALVDDGEIDFAVVPDGEFEAARLFYPELRDAFPLGSPQAVGWLYRPGPKNSLWDMQLRFFNVMRETGELQVLRDRYFGHIGEFDYVESRAFLRHYDERLPPYRDSFVENATRYGFDWTLLAAMSYQESHWRDDARSPTGVRGLMMLTRRTAKQLGVDRLDPFESIRGGTEYLASLRERLPERIPEPDRTWLALAAYNVGLGHLEDARRFADGAGRDPDRWTDVRDYLPKLSNKSWARRARHGYARGYQAVHFVENIRRYHEVLRWLESDLSDAPAARPPPTLFAPVLPRGTAL